jgi:hypothetical protein
MSTQARNYMHEYENLNEKFAVKKSYKDLLPVSKLSEHIDQLVSKLIKYQKNQLIQLVTSQKIGCHLYVR